MSARSPFRTFAPALALAAGLLIPGLPSAAAQERRQEEWVREVARLMEEGHADEAAGVCEKRCQDRPNDAESWVQYGNVLWALTRYEEALAALDRAGGLAAEDPRVDNQRGLVLIALERYQEAYEAFESALGKDASFEPAAWNLGEILFKGGKYADARPYLEKSVDLGGKRVRAYVYLAEIDIAAADAGAAEKRYLQALKDTGEGPLLYTKLGNLFYRTGKLDPAIANFGKALSLDASYADAHYGLGLSYARKKDLAAAEAALRAAMEADAGHVPSRMDLARILQARGGEALEEARGLYWQVLAAAPQFAPAIFNLGVLEEGAGKLEDAETAYRRVLSIDPKHRGAAVNLGLILHKSGRVRETVDLLREAREHHPEDLDIKLNLALAMIEYGVDLERAFDMLKEVAETAKEGKVQGLRALAAIEKIRRQIEGEEEKK